LEGEHEPAENIRSQQAHVERQIQVFARTNISILEKSGARADAHSKAVVEEIGTTLLKKQENEEDRS